MKRRKIILIIILLLVFLVPFLSWLFWNIQETRELKVLILDKTVVNTLGQEHLSLNWVLNNEKFGTEELELYNAKEDYFGFFPDDDGNYEIVDFNDYSKSEVDSLADNYDMVYYADLYGIYRAEWYETYPQVAPEDYEIIPATERSSLIYGGMTRKELNLLKAMKEQKKLIITEFNIIASPTSYRIRHDFEKEFGVTWSRWVGRYFESLDTTKNKELPRWLKNNYLIQNDSTWPFTKSGIVFVRNDDRIIILENETQLETETPIIYTPKLQQEIFGLPADIKYPFWFDICYTEDPAMLISYYKIHTNHVGDSTLKANGIPDAFPAVIRGVEDYPYYYFAGDFADNPISMSLSKFKHSQLVSSFTYSSSVQERSSFFWDFYQPLMSTILNDYYSSANKIK